MGKRLIERIEIDCDLCGGVLNEIEQLEAEERIDADSCLVCRGKGVLDGVFILCPNEEGIPIQYACECPAGQAWAESFYLKQAF